MRGASSIIGAPVGDRIGGGDLLGGGPLFVFGSTFKGPGSYDTLRAWGSGNLEEVEFEGIGVVEGTGVGGLDADSSSSSLMSSPPMAETVVRCTQ